MQENEFVTAQRTDCFVKIGVTGVSGSGKTETSLRVAFGLVGDWRKVFLIDTEHNSANLYAHLGPFQHMNLTDTSYHGYIGAMDKAYQRGAKAIIVDSASHFWNWCLDYHFSLDPSGKNAFYNWKKVNPFWDDFKMRFLKIPAHFFLTMRRDTAHEVSVINGRSVIEKLGAKIEMRKGFEYELTALLEISIDHIATATKDRTGVFNKLANTSKPLDSIAGLQLYKWCNLKSNTDPDSVENRLIALQEMILKIEDIELLEALYAQNIDFINLVPDAMNIMNEKIEFLRSINAGMANYREQSQETPIVAPPIASVPVAESKNWIFARAYETMSLEVVAQDMPQLKSSQEIGNYILANKKWLDENPNVLERIINYQNQFIAAGR